LYCVRALAMPGANLDVKLFLAVTGGDPPDVVNHDDPIVADWASRGAIVPLDAVASPRELEPIEQALFPVARELGLWQGKLFGLCNGLDVRALYTNEDLLRKYGLKPPSTIDDLDRIADTVAAAEGTAAPAIFGFVPTPRSLWSWGYVFGGQFVDPITGCATLDHPGLVAALQWMVGYGQRFGAAAILAQARDQSLPGKSFPLLAGRQVTLVDGQWRIRDIELFAAECRRLGRPVPRFGVYPLPRTPSGHPNAGWINGNIFVIPRGANNKRGAWEFMKFWCGLQGHAAAAAKTCIRGGWIPVTPAVVQQPTFQAHLLRQPLWNTFLAMAQSPYQHPRPNIRGAMKLDRELQAVAERAMLSGSADSAHPLLRAVSDRFNAEAK
jgi:multiple sugar transport system substrate-binding protein